MLTSKEEFLSTELKDREDFMYFDISNEVRHTLEPLYEGVVPESILHRAILQKMIWEIRQN